MRIVTMWLQHTLTLPAILLSALSFLPAQAAQPVQVILEKVATSHFTDRVEALGTLRARETVDITATVMDTVTAIRFDDGQRVQKGDILIEMTSAEEHAQLEEEMSTVAEAQKQYNRLQSLEKQGATAKAQLDEQRRDLDTARARLRIVESRLQDHLILAPFSGVLGLRNISVGALIEPGDRITTLDDDSVMKLEFTVPAVHLTAISKGLNIEASSAAYGDRIFSGQIDSIDSRIDPNTRAIKVRAVLANDERLLKPGLLMRVVLLKRPRDTLVIPEEALIPSGKSNYVLVVKPETQPNIAERREVQIGARRPGEVEIVAGLGADEYVITHGTLRVRPGQAVTVLAIAEGNEPLAELLSKKQGEVGK
jgi:membrane fusion protein (multidrug efflux system)